MLETLDIPEVETTTKKRVSRTVKKKRSRAKAKAGAKLVKRNDAPKGVYCKVCKDGPFKSEAGLSIHNGKPANRSTHLDAGHARAERKVTNKHIQLVDALSEKWMAMAVANTRKAERSILMQCVIDLKMAFNKA